MFTRSRVCVCVCVSGGARPQGISISSSFSYPLVSLVGLFCWTAVSKTPDKVWPFSEMSYAVK